MSSGIGATHDGRGSGGDSRQRRIRYNVAMVEDEALRVGDSTRAVLTSDSSAGAERLQVRLWRGMSPLDKARTVSALTRAAQELSLAGIRQRHPGAPERECLLRLAALKLGSDLTQRAYPEAAAFAGS